MCASESITNPRCVIRVEGWRVERGFLKVYSKTVAFEQSFCSDCVCLR